MDDSASGNDNGNGFGNNDTAAISRRACVVVRCCCCCCDVGCWMNDTKRMAQQARQNLKFGAPERRFFAKMSLAPEAAADDDGEFFVLSSS